jgi:hypothetical protein
MQHDQKQLHQLARDYLWYMFTGEEIAAICNVSQNVISRVKSLADSPFFLNKCRPEWFLEWMRVHSNFQLTKADIPDLDRRQGHMGSATNSNSSRLPPKIIRRSKRRPKRPATRKR